MKFLLMIFLVFFSACTSKIFSQSSDKNEFEKNIKNLTDSISHDPNNYSFYFKRGNEYASEKKYGNALEDYTSAIRTNPNDTDIYYFRGYIFHIQNKFDSAIIDYTKAIGLNPKNAGAYSNRADCFRKQSKYELSLKDYTQAISIDPKRYLSYYSRGGINFLLNKFDDAIIDFSETISQNPKYLNAYFRRAETFQSLNQTDMALQDYLTILKIDTANSKAYTQFELIYLDKALGFWKLAEVNATNVKSNAESNIRNLYEEAVLGRKDTTSEYVVVKIEEEKKQAKELIDILTRVIDKCPSVAFAYIERANMYEDQKIFDLAVRDYKVALSIEPTNSKVRTKLVELEKKLKLSK